MLIRWYIPSHTVVIFFNCVQLVYLSELPTASTRGSSNRVASSAETFAKEKIQDEVRRFELDVKTVNNLAKSERARPLNSLLRGHNRRHGNESEGINLSFDTPQRDNGTYLKSYENVTSWRGNSSSPDTWLQNEYNESLAQQYTSGGENSTLVGETDGNTQFYEDSFNKVANGSSQPIPGRRRRLKPKVPKDAKSTQGPAQNTSKIPIETTLDNLERIPSSMKHKYYSHANPTLQVENDLIPVSNTQHGRELIIESFKQGTAQNDQFQQQLATTHLGNNTSKNSKDASINKGPMQERNMTTQLSSNKTAKGPEDKVKKVAGIVKENVFFPGVSYPNLYSFRANRIPPNAMEVSTPHPIIVDDDESPISNHTATTTERPKILEEPLLDLKPKSNTTKKDKKVKSIETIEHLKKAFVKKDEVETTTSAPLNQTLTGEASKTKLKPVTVKPSNDKLVKGNYNPITKIRDVLQVPFIGTKPEKAEAENTKKKQKGKEKKPVKD